MIEGFSSHVGGGHKGGQCGRRECSPNGQGSGQGRPGDSSQQGQSGVVGQVAPQSTLDDRMHHRAGHIGMVSQRDHSNQALTRVKKVNSRVEREI